MTTPPSINSKSLDCNSWVQLHQSKLKPTHEEYSNSLPASDSPPESEDPSDELDELLDTVARVNVSDPESGESPASASSTTKTPVRKSSSPHSPTTSPISSTPILEEKSKPRGMTFQEAAEKATLSEIAISIGDIEKTLSQLKLVVEKKAEIDEQDTPKLKAQIAELEDDLRIAQERAANNKRIMDSQQEEIHLLKKILANSITVKEIDYGSHVRIIPVNGKGTIYNIENKHIFLSPESQGNFRKEMAQKEFLGYVVLITPSVSTGTDFTGLPKGTKYTVVHVQKDPL